MNRTHGLVNVLVVKWYTITVQHWALSWYLGIAYFFIVVIEIKQVYNFLDEPGPSTICYVHKLNNETPQSP